MANNRLYLVCTICLDDPNTTCEECFLLLAAYFPRQGWELFYSFPARAGGWLDGHRHGGLCGDFLLSAIDESKLNDPRVDVKRALLIAGLKPARTS